MMLLAERLALNEVFRAYAAAKRRELRDIEFMEELSDERKHVAEREKEEREFFEQFEVATQSQIAAFESRLETYDTAIVRALMENERQMEDVQKRLKDIEHSAYKLPDGTAVFKTEDGQHVFNLKGVELSHDIIDPSAIPDSNLKWNSVVGVVRQEEKLAKERSEIHDFEKQVHAARQEGAKGGVLRKELDGLDAELNRKMPASVRRELPDYLPVQDAELSKRPDMTPTPTSQGLRPGGF